MASQPPVQNRRLWQWLTLTLLVTAVVASAMGVVYGKFQSRALFDQLQALRLERDGLEVEWGQLQLEQSAWAAHGRVESMARTQLDMVLPSDRQARVVTP